MARKNSSQKTLTRIIAGAIIIAAGFVIYTTFLSQPAVEVLPGEQTEDLPNINTSALDDRRIDSFHSWQSLPLEVGVTGRDNPFSE